MNRRQLIKAGVYGGLSLGGFASGAIWLNTPANTFPLSIDAVLAKLDIIVNSAISSSGIWNPYQIFMHCAQSVELSVLGFPEHKSDFFKSTAGKMAFSVFSAKGEMTHSLSEPIPGALRIESEGNVQWALERFKTSLLNFQAFEGKLAPHFAYGELSKQDYERAHVMHFYNHLQEMTL